MCVCVFNCIVLSYCHYGVIKHGDDDGDDDDDDDDDYIRGSIRTWTRICCMRNPDIPSRGVFPSEIPPGIPQEIPENPLENT